MRSTTQLLAFCLVLADLSSRAAEQPPWYYHVKSGGSGGRPVQSETDPGLASCWNSINAAFAVVKSRATPGPWIIQVDDEATYDEAVVLADLQTSSTETLTLTKAPWLAGRPTIHPHQLFRRALAINGLWPGFGDPLPDQPGQASRRVTHVTVRGLIFKNNASGTDKTTEESVFTDNQSYLTEGLHFIEDCVFDGQNQVYDSRNPIGMYRTCINTAFRRNCVQNFIMNDTNKVSQWGRYGHGAVFVMTGPVTNVVRQPQVTIADNTFRENKGFVAIFVGDTNNQWHYPLVFERNQLIRNDSIRYSIMLIELNALSNLIQNNLFADNSSARGSLYVYDASNTRIYHNTFVNNHTGREVAVTGNSNGVEIKNNLFWPTPGGHRCIDVDPGDSGNLICANNAFFTDWKKDGHPPGSGFSTNENTEVVGFWKNVPMTTSDWNNPAKKTSSIWSFFQSGSMQSASMNNTGNGYTLGGLGLDKNGRPIAGSLCIDRGVPGLVCDDIDGKPRPVGGGYDIGAVEYGTTAKAVSPVK